MLTVGISMQLQWGPLMRDQYKGDDSFHFFFCTNVIIPQSLTFLDIK